MNQLLYNKKNTGIDSRIIVIILSCILFLFVFYILIFKIVPSPSNKETKTYNIVLPMHSDAKNKNLCPYNCVRGNCNLSNIVKKEIEEGKQGIGVKCKHDYQCNYCKDPKTNQFYVNNYQEKHIIHELEEEPHLTPIQKHILNDDINGYNEYIHKLNDKIKKVNGLI
jgi:signal recognition particle subunit SEC65